MKTLAIDLNIVPNQKGSIAQLIKSMNKTTPQTLDQFRNVSFSDILKNWKGFVSTPVHASKKNLPMTHTDKIAGLVNEPDTANESPEKNQMKDPPVLSKSGKNGMSQASDKKSAISKVSDDQLFSNITETVLPETPKLAQSLYDTLSPTKEAMNFAAWTGIKSGSLPDEAAQGEGEKALISGPKITEPTMKMPLMADMSSPEEMVHPGNHTTTDYFINAAKVIYQEKGSHLSETPGLNPVIEPDQDVETAAKDRASGLWATDNNMRPAGTEFRGSIADMLWQKDGNAAPKNILAQVCRMDFSLQDAKPSAFPPKEVFFAARTTKPAAVFGSDSGIVGKPVAPVYTEGKSGSLPDEATQGNTASRSSIMMPEPTIKMDIMPEIPSPEEIVRSSYQTTKDHVIHKDLPLFIKKTDISINAEKVIPQLQGPHSSETSEPPPAANLGRDRDTAITDHAPIHGATDNTHPVETEVMGRVAAVLQQKDDDATGKNVLARKYRMDPSLHDNKPSVPPLKEAAFTATVQKPAAVVGNDGDSVNKSVVSEHRDGNVELPTRTVTMKDALAAATMQKPAAVVGNDRDIASKSVVSEHRDGSVELPTRTVTMKNALAAATMQKPAAVVGNDRDIASKSVVSEHQDGTVELPTRAVTMKDVLAAATGRETDNDKTKGSAPFHPVKHAEGESFPLRMEPVSASFALEAGKSVSDSPAGIRTQAIIDQILDAKQGMSSDFGRVRIVLAPPNLGTVDLEIVLRKERVEVIMTADNAKVQQVLQSCTDDIRTALQRHDLKIDTFQVILHNNDANQQQTQSGTMFEQRREHSARQNNNKDGRLITPTSASLERSEPAKGLLSVFA